MLNETQIGEIWSMFAEYIDKKIISVAAEHYVELLVDSGVRDQTLKHAIGIDYYLDQAIQYYLEEDDKDDEDIDELEF